MTFAQKYISFRYFLKFIKSNLAITKSDPRQTLRNKSVSHKMCVRKVGTIYVRTTYVLGT